MKLKSISIKNFRSCKNMEILIDGYTCLVGPNGSGKSTILQALNVFFQQTDNVVTNLKELDKEDFYNKDVTNPMEIKLKFVDLNEEAQEDFKHYYRSNELNITAKAIFEGGRATVKRVGERLVMEDFKPYFRVESDGGYVAELRKEYSKIRNHYPELPDVKSKPEMEDALRKYEENHPEKCTLEQSESEFFGFTRGRDRLSKYVHWVYVPAVKDASREKQEERNTDLGRLLQYTIRRKSEADEFSNSMEEIKEEASRKYAEFLRRNQALLESVSQSLQENIRIWGHADAEIKLQWQEDSKSIQINPPMAYINAKEGIFDGGDITRCGHGFQRSYLIALLHTLANINPSIGPTLILGCEEPELYQHPPQIRHLADVLTRLSNREHSSQIIISTHSPLLVSGKTLQGIRMIRKEGMCSTVSQIRTMDDTRNEKKLIQSILRSSISEMFFTEILILVEGQEDLAYISSYFELSGKWDQYRQLGCHIITVDGKKNLPNVIEIAKQVNIPLFVVFDGDGKGESDPDNCAILRSLSEKNDDCPETMTAKGVNYIMWKNKISSVMKEEMGILFELNKLSKKPTIIKCKLLEAWEAGKRSSSLDILCDSILEFGNNLSM